MAHCKFRYCPTRTNLIVLFKCLVIERLRDTPDPDKNLFLRRKQ